MKLSLFSKFCYYGFVFFYFSQGSAQNSIDSLNLQTILSKAIENNAALKNSALEIEKSEETKKSILHTYIPTVELGGKYAYTQGELNLETTSIPIDVPGFNLPPIIPGFPPITVPSTGLEIPPIDQNIDFNGNLWMGGLTAKWTLFTGLKAPYLSKAMEHKIKAQEQQYIQREADLIIEVSEYYDKIALLEKTKLVLNIQRERLNKETLVAKKAFEQGLITRHELQKTEIFQLELDSKQLEYEGAKELLMLKLEQLTGIPIIQLELLEVELTPRLNQELEKTYLDRPEITALDESIIASEYKYKSEVSGYLPKVQAFYTHQYAGMTNGELGILGFEEVSAYPLNALGVGMKWEIFDGLHSRGQRLKAKIDLEQLTNKKEEVQELLALNYQNCISRYRTLSAQVELKRKQQKSAEKSLEISYKEYTNGLIKLSDYLEAQADLTTTILEYYQTVCSQRRSALDLLNATGSIDIQKL
ncbi:TolC family protein [Urechidicola vernalis]|uniref:TolC family protein n=1 Tax=Urechidicola vernalis TaxID=3075600 RepID=A0ABU2Y7P4_9FLAO|nr:TolC family protein [Urechidicola sp. P050]MDT0554223.1 TolC family protein [Urechidicola sp. P050]